YATQARARLADNPKAQKLARLALSTAWRPVGSGIASDGEVTDVMTHLFGGKEGRKSADAIDRHIGKLPGMGGLTIVADSLDARRVAACPRGAPTEGRRRMRCRGVRYGRVVRLEDGW